MGGLVYVTTGNGDVFEDAKSPDVPGGAALCLDAQTGEEKWRFTTPNGIIAAPAVGAGRIYFGCRDAHLYCVGRADGKLRWKHCFLDSPVIATPVLDIPDPDFHERTHQRFSPSAANGGKIGCYEPVHGGHRVWSYSLADQQALHLHLHASPRGHAARRRAIVGNSTSAAAWAAERPTSSRIGRCSTAWKTP